MKGVLLAGGTGSRLFPLTKVTNKHLLPVYNKPMIYYPIKTLVDADIKEILIITGPEHAGDFLKLLGSGKEFGVRLTYELQDEAGGIAQALSLAEPFVDNDKCIVILGDNIFEDDIKKFVKAFEKQENGARIFLKRVKTPERFGVVEIKNGKVVYMEEKPKNPKTNISAVGLYMYDNTVFEKVKRLKPSGRGELEINDVNLSYMKEGNLKYNFLRGFWTDAGTFPSLFKASQLVKKKENRN
ncbi:MAG: NTP transferase domain-containing protein [Candidatus Aenigmarchaeota archaeon]|nr:NTP transferase domain-containing protein [Candidatus Aenigmarchaeota archaeon]